MFMTTVTTKDLESKRLLDSAEGFSKDLPEWLTEGQESSFLPEEVWPGVDQPLTAPQDGKDSR